MYGYTTLLKMIVTMLLCLCSQSLMAASLSPLYVRNYSPMVHYFGLPVMPDLDALQEQNNQWSIHAAYSSHFAAAVTPRELLIVDGESHYYTMQYQWRLTPQTYLQLDIPYLGFRGGTLDGFIEEWHHVFSLPQSGRTTLDKNRLQFYYERDGKVVFNSNPESAGLGDINLSWNRSLAGTSHLSPRHRALVVNLKLPTGSKLDWLGSGAVDLAIGLAERRQQEWWNKPAALFFSSGLLLPGKAYRLSDRQRPLVLYGGAGAALQWQSRLVFKAQVDLHTAFYTDTDIAPLGQEAAQLTLGGDILIPNGRIELAVSEDLIIDASPDVTFNIGVSLLF